MKVAQRDEIFLQQLFVNNPGEVALKQYGASTGSYLFAMLQLLIKVLDA